MPAPEDAREDVAADFELRGRGHAGEAVAGEGVLGWREEARFLARGDVGEDEEAAGERWVVSVVGDGLDGV